MPKITILQRLPARLCGVGAGLLVALAASTGAEARPDLRVTLSAPEVAMPGADISGNVRVTVRNRGSTTAAGTASRGRDGFMIDLFLTRSTMPSGFARFSETYFDGVLLRGGRESNTRDLSPGRSATYRMGGTIPADTPDGQYRLCAHVDPGKKVREANEDNNLSCTTIRIARLRILQIKPFVRDLGPLRLRLLERPEELGLDRLRVLPGRVQPPQPTGGGEAERTVLEDGTIEIRQPDGSIRRLRPDGKVETVLPNGQAIVPYALEVQGADLPDLPDPLSGWGTVLADSLLGIIRNILTDAEYEAYRQLEEGKDYYDVIDVRLRSIAFLTSAEGG